MDRIIVIDDSQIDLQKYQTALEKYQTLIELKCFDNGVDALDFLCKCNDQNTKLIFLDQHFLVKQENGDGIEPHKLFYKGENGINPYMINADLEFVAGGQSDDAEQGFLILEKIQEYFNQAPFTISPSIIMCTSDIQYAERASSLGADHIEKADMIHSPEAIINCIESKLSIKLKTLQEELIDLGIPNNSLPLFGECKKVYKRKWKELVKKVIEEAKKNGPLTYGALKKAKEEIKILLEDLSSQDYWFLLKEKDSNINECILQNAHEDHWFYAFQYKKNKSIEGMLFLLKPEITNKSIGAKNEAVKILDLDEDAPFLGTDHLVYSDESSTGGLISLKYNLDKSKFILDYEKEEIMKSWKGKHGDQTLLPLELILYSDIPGKFSFLDHFDSFVDGNIFKNSSNSIDKYLLTDVKTQLPKVVIAPTYGVGEKAGAKWEKKAFDAIVEELNLANINEYWIIAGHHFVFPKSREKSNETDLVIIHPGGIHLCECKAAQGAKYIYGRPDQLKNQISAFNDYFGELLPVIQSGNVPVYGYYLLPQIEVKKDEDRGPSTLIKEIKGCEQIINKDQIVKLGVHFERCFSTDIQSDILIQGIELKEYRGHKNGFYEYIGERSEETFLIREYRITERSPLADDFQGRINIIRDDIKKLKLLPKSQELLVTDTFVCKSNDKEVHITAPAIEAIYAIFPLPDVYSFEECRGLNLGDKLGILRDLAFGVKKLHEFNIVHGHICEENILILKRGNHYGALIDGLYNTSTDGGKKKDIIDLIRVFKRILPDFETIAESTAPQAKWLFDLIAKKIHVPSPIAEIAETIDLVFKVYSASVVGGHNKVELSRKKDADVISHDTPKKEIIPQVGETLIGEVQKHISNERGCYGVIIKFNSFSGLLNAINMKNLKKGFIAVDKEFNLGDKVEVKIKESSHDSGRLKVSLEFIRFISRNQNNI